uniref:Uncharacterized protein n=1 Tax=Arundo donax TaxID=35708 RepID=A0A0A9CFE5_ARUDO
MHTFGVDCRQWLMANIMKLPSK